MSDATKKAEGDARWSAPVYEELRSLAAALMSRERTGHTLQPTELVHEAWLRLTRSRNAGTLARGEFLGLAAQAMRRILTEHARRRLGPCRGGAWRRTALATGAVEAEAGTFAVDLDAALGELAALDPDLAHVVELRFYAGASVEETAAALDISQRTVKRRWRFARAWLQRRMTEAAE